MSHLLPLRFILIKPASTSLGNTKLVNFEAIMSLRIYRIMPPPLSFQFYLNDVLKLSILNCKTGKE